jgi:hypothetical protein
MAYASRLEARKNQTHHKLTSGIPVTGVYSATASRGICRPVHLFFDVRSSGLT